MIYLRKLLKFYTQTELAEKLGYSSRSTISNWIKVKKIPNHKIGHVRQLAENLK